MSFHSPSAWKAHVRKIGNLHDESKTRTRGENRNNSCKKAAPTGISWKLHLFPPSLDLNSVIRSIISAYVLWTVHQNDLPTEDFPR